MYAKLWWSCGNRKWFCIDVCFDFGETELEGRIVFGDIPGFGVDLIGGPDFGIGCFFGPGNAPGVPPAEYTPTTVEQAAACADALQELAAERECEAFAFFPALRISVSGLAGGPDLLPLLALLGKEKVLTRINRALETHGNA